MLSFHFEVCLRLFISILVRRQCPILYVFILHDSSVPCKRSYNMFLYSVINCISCHKVSFSCPYIVKISLFIFGATSPGGPGSPHSREI
jgi:hypothetical protein